MEDRIKGKGERGKARLALALFFILYPLPFTLAAESTDTRLHALYKQIRCVVCDAESIDESPALLAADMRTFVKQAVEAGQSDDAILASLQQRYGDKVLMMPPVRADTVLLWTAPFMLLILGVFIWARKK